MKKYFLAKTPKSTYKKEFLTEALGDKVTQAKGGGRLVSS